MNDVAAAERACLGALIQSPELVRAVPRLLARHFADPRHRTIFEAVHAAARLDSPVLPTLVPDELVVLDRLQVSGQLKAGSLDGPYLAGLIESVPVLTNLVWYAQIVLDAARRRALLAHAEKVRAAAETASDDDALTESMARLLVDAEGLAVPQSVSAGGRLVGYHKLSDFVFDEDADDSPWVIPGILRLMERVVVVASEGAGKRLRVDEPVPTPTGWTTMGALHVGDEVLDAFGVPCRVLGVSEIEPEPDAYEVVFNDGERIEADAEHQWLTVDYRARQLHGGHELRVRTTAEIRRTLQARGGHTLNHAVPVAGALQLPAADLPVPPYTLGVWLGDGSKDSAVVTLNRLDADSIEAGMRSEGIGCHRQVCREKPGCVGTWIEMGGPMLRNLGVLGAKHIPDVYLRGSFDQRLALLRGLMDTDGYVSDRGESHGRGAGSSACELTFTSKTLVPGAVELIRTLGIRAQVAESDAVLNGRVIGRRWRITFQSPFNPFSAPRKADRWRPVRTARSRYRYIKSVERVTPTPMRCIAVDSPSSSYLVGEAMIPTHNTTLARVVATATAGGRHFLNPESTIPFQRTLMVDLENPPSLIRSKMRPMVERLRGLRSWDDERAWLYTRPGGINLRSPDDAAALERVIEQARPQLVCFGPVYKAFVEGATDRAAQAAREVVAVLDRLREKHKFALWVEAHAPLEQGGRRELRPFGSQLWLAWPEFGIGLRRDDNDPRGHTLLVERFRGDRDEREWPSKLFRGDPSYWPYEGEWANGMPQWLMHNRAWSA